MYIAWMADKWEEIPTEQQAQLQHFAVELLHSKAGTMAAYESGRSESTAVKIAMMLLGIQVAMRIIPQWTQLWARLDRILRSCTNGDDLSVVSTAVRETIEAYWSAATGSKVKVGSIECPAPGVFKMRDLAIGNPPGFTSSVDAIRIDSIDIALLSAPHLTRKALEACRPLLVVDSLVISGVSLRLEFRKINDL
ncbi:MAG: hypothetical protein ACPIOQ_68445, partial [Promethearchaeia archaeon]